jgi:phosphohistidine phosphatase
MERKIVFVRHVSSPKPAGIEDFDRPIDASGREDAAKMARHLESEGHLPRRVLCSEAERARQTLEAMREAFEVEDSAFDADVTRELYHTDVDGTCEHIWALPEDCAEIMLVGHNPVWSDAVSWLTGVRTNMPKGAAAVLTCRGEAWSGAVQRDGCGLLAFVRPAELR